MIRAVTCLRICSICLTGALISVRAFSASPITIFTPTSPLPAGTVGQLYSPVPLQAFGGTEGAFTWSVTGLPAGLSVRPSGDLGGTPAAGSEGLYSPQFTATDSSNDTATVTVSLTINSSGPHQTPINTAITLTSVSPAAPRFGQAVTLTATVTPASAVGSVSFMDRGALVGIGTVNASGIAQVTTLTLAAGPHSLRAFFGGGGDGVYQPSQSAALSCTVTAVLGSGFAAPVSYSVVAELPESIVVGDFNGDGVVDLATGGVEGGNVLLGKDDGTFGTAINYFYFGTRTTAVADFNADGRLDLAATQDTGGVIQVLLGNGDGTMQNQITTSFGFRANVAAAGDFNADGKADVAYAGHNQFGLLLGNGAGAFQPAGSYSSESPVGFEGSSVAVADLDGDGNADIVVGGLNGLMVALGDGLGLFQAGLLPPFGESHSFSSVQLADFNGDGNLDLVVADIGSDNVSLFLGKGDGTFNSPTSIANSVNPIALTLGDFNGDGATDLVMINGASSDVMVLMGNGDGTFQPAVHYGAGSEPNSIVVADFNGDGRADLAVTNFPGNTLSILLATAPGTTNPLNISGSLLQLGIVGMSFSPVQFNASGGTGGYIWSATGLPNGLVISSGGVLSGTPAAGTQGQYNPQIKVTDSSNVSTTVTRSLTINPVLAIVGPASLPPISTNFLATYSPVQFVATGGTGVYVWSAIGLPQGMDFSSSGQLRGPANPGTEGTYNVTFKVTDSSNASASVTLALLVKTDTSSPPLTFAGPSSLPGGNLGNAYGPVQLSAGGGSPPYSWSATGLPSGLTLNSAGVLSGTPTPGTIGTYHAQVSVTDSLNSMQTITLSLIIVNELPVIMSVSPNPALPGSTGQTLFINGSGFQNGLSVQLTEGPAHVGFGASFLSATQISILLPPTGPDAATWTIQVINPDGQSSNVFPFSISAPPAVTSFALPQFIFGGAWYTALYFSNPTNSIQSITVNFVGDDGLPLSVPLVGIGTVSSQTLSLNPRSTVILEALNDAGSSTEGWVEASLPAGVVGYAVFRQVVVGRADQEAVVPLTPESSQTADLTYDDIQFTTSVAFLNPSDQIVTVTINTFDTTGVPNGSAQVVLAPRAKVATVLKELTGLAGVTGNRGRAIFAVASGAVSVIGLRFGGSAFTSIPVVHRPANPVTQTISFALPQFVFGGAWYTAMYFSNTTNSVVDVPVSFTGDNGTPLDVQLNGIGTVTTQTVPLNPGATAILEAPLTDDSGEGWAQATLPPGVIGYGVFRQTIPGRFDQEAVVPLTLESDQIADLIYDDIAFTTSVAFLNPSDQQTTVTITVYSANGAQLGTTQVVLAPHAKMAEILKEQPGLQGIAGNRGWATFSVSNGAVSVIGLRFGAEAFTSIPVAQR